jgi:hypothetical protein
LPVAAGGRRWHPDWAGWADYGRAYEGQVGKHASMIRGIVDGLLWSLGRKHVWAKKKKKMFHELWLHK